ncbi:hypothetical protein HPP92_027160 [Vanilla planifolia]|uniref:Uncharacterized protein n=1 Tax=Vanilla planifolia TaxID=51239 RepID=A0A835PC07_VANPL|nr:hypothetical protein HPP92_027160 [Vanilla planifolia]
MANKVLKSLGKKGSMIEGRQSKRESPKACKLKLGNLKGALLDTEFALHESDSNAKTYYRRGQAYVALNDMDGALGSFKKALELEPNDGGIKREIAAARKKIFDKRDQEKRAFSKMFQ